MTSQKSKKNKNVTESQIKHTVYTIHFLNGNKYTFKRCWNYDDRRIFSSTWSTVSLLLAEVTLHSDDVILRTVSPHSAICDTSLESSKNWNEKSK